MRPYCAALFTTQIEMFKMLKIEGSTFNSSEREL